MASPTADPEQTTCQLAHLLEMKVEPGELASYSATTTEARGRLGLFAKGIWVWLFEPWICLALALALLQFVCWMYKHRDLIWVPEQFTPPVHAVHLDHSGGFTPCVRWFYLCLCRRIQTKLLGQRLQMHACIYFFNHKTGYRRHQVNDACYLNTESYSTAKMFALNSTA